MERLPDQGDQESKGSPSPSRRDTSGTGGSSPRIRFQRLGSRRTSESLEVLGVDTSHLCGVSLDIPTGQGASQSAANTPKLLLAARLVHKAQYERIKDAQGRGVDEWKESRRQSCWRMFIFTISGILTAMWADYTLYLDDDVLTTR
mmetsp:Transcript_20247/g.56094  ORF Transcript_20247/g.56094 Transcript_20247/m.56094 type:complete len:146 (+) Transcript_20247:64-501(+)